MTSTTPDQHPASCGASMARGAFGFLIVSLAGFGVWAMAGRGLYKAVGEPGLYLLCAIVFLGLSGPLLYSLLGGTDRVKRFYKIFIPAFLAYAVIWSGSWFALKFGAGEWLGSALGCLAFAAIVRRHFKGGNQFALAVFILFLLHSAGYFSGGKVYGFVGHSKPPPFGLSKPSAGLLAKFLWGACYGLGFGAGIGYVFHQFQRGTPAAAAPEDRS